MTLVGRFVIAVDFSAAPGLMKMSYALFRLPEVLASS
jgi:hypothetical protein